MLRLDFLRRGVLELHFCGHRILASAVEWGHLEALPHLPKIKVPEAPWDFFTKEETTQLLAAERAQPERLLLMFALHTGARACEQLHHAPWQRRGNELGTR